ncbi:hypothetical protein EJ06DRAFT_585640 [Trichodelitschia bisporula]|uniref:Stress-response A/B barrel domain-containing protein n=1 Tax=Trichodelitschia bisporula TaxID=703511 RepID=A0A6G1HJ68_9PEZI|nr:hypothetical protein EJ06DRAFT_585640 [Trichodelitschia bisporula]
MPICAIFLLQFKPDTPPYIRAEIMEEFLDLPDTCLNSVGEAYITAANRALNLPHISGSWDGHDIVFLWFANRQDLMYFLRDDAYWEVYRDTLDIYVGSFIQVNCFIRTRGLDPYGREMHITDEQRDAALYAGWIRANWN